MYNVVVKLLSKGQTLELTLLLPQEDEEYQEPPPTFLCVGLSWAQQNCNWGNQTGVEDLKLIWRKCMYQKESKWAEIKRHTVHVDIITSFNIKWSLSKVTTPFILHSYFYTHEWVLPSLQFLTCTLHSSLFILNPPIALCIIQLSALQ